MAPTLLQQGNSQTSPPPVLRPFCCLLLAKVLQLGQQQQHQRQSKLQLQPPPSLFTFRPSLLCLLLVHDVCHSPASLVAQQSKAADPPAPAADHSCKGLPTDSAPRRLPASCCSPASLVVEGQQQSKLQVTPPLPLVSISLAQAPSPAEAPAQALNATQPTIRVTFTATNLTSMVGAWPAARHTDVPQCPRVQALGWNGAVHATPRCRCQCCSTSARPGCHRWCTRAAVLAASCCGGPVSSGWTVSELPPRTFAGCQHARKALHGSFAQTGQALNSLP